jgi:hypothetical protein
MRSHPFQPHAFRLGAQCAQSFDFADCFDDVQVQHKALADVIAKPRASFEPRLGTSMAAEDRGPGDSSQSRGRLILLIRPVRNRDFLEGAKNHE